MCGVASPLLYQTRAPARLGELGVNFGELRVRGEGASHGRLEHVDPVLTYLSYLQSHAGNKFTNLFAY